MTQGIRNDRKEAHRIIGEEEDDARTGEIDEEKWSRR